MTPDHPNPEAAEGEIRFGPFRLLPSQQALYQGTERIRLGSRAFELLVVLCQSPGELMSKDQLLARVWPNLHVDETALRVHVVAVRKALGVGPEGEPYIVNVVGRGYRFSSPVTSTPAVAPARRTSSPTPRALPRIVGREETVASIAQQLPQHRLVTIVGAGGIGKTTVALALAERLAPDYAEAAHVVDLSTLAHDGLVPAAIAFSLGLSNLADDASSGVIAALREKRLLLVLDCCERVIEGAAILVEQILAGAPAIHILATSREPLRALGERVIWLPPLVTPPASAGITAEQAAAFSAVQLFLERASASLDDFTLTDANAPLVAAICMRLDGIALAIELVAGHVNAFDLQTLATMLDGRLSLLGPSRRTAVPRHKTLRAVLDWSFETIADRERLLLRRFAIFTGSADLPAVQDIVADSALSQQDIVEALSTLVDKSLVAVDLSGGAARYRLLDTTRAYAREKLRESSEANAMALRHARHYQAALATARARLTSATISAWLAEYSRKLGDVRSALDWAFSSEGEPSVGVKLAAEALPVMFEMSLTEECRRRAAEALAALPLLAEPDPALEMRLGTILGAAMMYTPGPVPQTIETWERVLTIATELAVASGQARSLWALWTACVYTGRPREALGYAQLFSQVKIEGAEVFTRGPGERSIGVALHLMGDQHAARRYLEGMLAVYVPREAEFYTPGFQIDHGAMARVTLARVLWVMGEPDQALGMLEDVLTEVRGTSHALSICYALIEAALPVRIMVGDLDGAEQELDLLQSLAEQSGFSIWQASVRGVRLAIRAKRGIAISARDIREAFSALRATGYTAPVAWLSGVIAEAGSQQNGVDARLGLVDEAIATCERSGELWSLPELLRIRAKLTMLQNSAAADEARALLVRALELARQQGAGSWEQRIATTAAALFGEDLGGVPLPAAIHHNAPDDVGPAGRP